MREIGSVSVTVSHHEKPPIWRNATVLKWAAQLILVAFIAVVVWTLRNQASQNIEARSITFGTNWLTEPPLISIREGIDQAPDSGARALYVGIVNTLRVSISGIIAATILGTIMGIARLSHNWIVNKIATVYIETIRNVPLLVQILFWLAVVQLLPEVTEDQVGEAWFIASVKGVSVPWLFPSGGFYQWLVFLVIGGALAAYVHHRLWKRKEELGGETHPFLWSLAVLLVFAIVGWFIHPVMAFWSGIWSGVASFFGAIPPVLLQVLLAATAVAAVVIWIRRFLDSMRTPAGLAKLTDDHWFRMIFVGVAGLFGVLLFVLYPAISEGILNLFESFFAFLSDKFDSSRTDNPLRFAKPGVELRGTGGFSQLAGNALVITPGFFALWIGVTLYTAAFIAEIVRGGILAVAKGQSEAGLALGLTRGQLLRFIVLPQAFRIVLPPIGNQYLNLFKNTSLGIAVAFPDIVQVGQTLYNQTGQTFPIVLTWMAFFLAGSLVLSSIVNYFNRSLELVER